MAYEVIQLDKDLWAIQDQTVRMYLLDGGKVSVLLDTGFGTGDLASVVHSLVSGEIVVVNTHSHADHTSGNRFFKKFYLPEKDREEIVSVLPQGAQIVSVKEGDIIEAGNVRLEVIEIPGHTPGSIALLQRERRRLFSSDIVAKNFPVYMQYPGQDLQAYFSSLKKLLARGDAYDSIYPCHGELYIDRAYLDKMTACCAGILDGSIPAGEAKNSEGNVERAYHFEDVAIFY